jgi:hypothetical protein
MARDLALTKPSSLVRSKLNRIEKRLFTQTHYSMARLFGTLALFFNEDERLELFIVGFDGVLYEIWHLVLIGFLPRGAKTYPNRNYGLHRVCFDGCQLKCLQLSYLKGKLEYQNLFLLITSINRSLNFSLTGMRLSAIKTWLSSILLSC